MQKNFDLSAGSLSEEFRWDLVIVGAEWLHERWALTRNLNSVFSQWESGLELHVFLHRFFLLYLYFPPLLEKRIDQLLPQSHEPTLSIQTRRGEGGKPDTCLYHHARINSQQKLKREISNLGWRIEQKVKLRSSSITIAHHHHNC